MKNTVPFCFLVQSHFNNWTVVILDPTKSFTEVRYSIVSRVGNTHKPNFLSTNDVVFWSDMELPRGHISSQAKWNYGYLIKLLLLTRIQLLQPLAFSVLHKLRQRKLWYQSIKIW
jgi:hypothetical protein